MIEFRAVTEADLPLLSRWMHQPHWQEWWGDPETELGYVRDMLAGKDSTRPYLFQVDGSAAGYIQVWFIKDQLTPRWLAVAPWMKLVPEDSVGVDLSIGDGASLSKGIGSAALRAFVQGLLKAGHESILIDPDPHNTRAVAAYRKAGFREIPDLIGKTGDSLIMQYQIEEGAPFS
ncbi:MAG: GNAT family N-acetyltransferase [Roseibium sp.]|nr:GNAT family N-acetyltransferase [Roseibium sp.]